MSDVQMCAMRAGFAKGVLELARLSSKIMLLGCDVTRSLFLDSFRTELPKQYISVGIAEQNAAGIAAGLALCGKKPVFATYAAFATTRALDQIRMSICYNNAGVFIAGAHAGLSVGPDGGSHQALEDIAVMRTLPGMTVVLPRDANETEAAIYHYLGGKMRSPVYMRFGRNEVPNFTEPKTYFMPGAGILSQGDGRLTIVTHGALVWHCKEALKKLAQHGVYPKLIQIRTLGDGLAENVLLDECDSPCVLVVDEHQQQGGVGSYVAEVLSRYPIPRSCPYVKCLGINDAFGQSGTPEELYQHYGLSTDKIYEAAEELIAKVQ